MKQNELTETFMMILNWEKPIGLYGLYRIISCYDIRQSSSTPSSAKTLTVIAYAVVKL